MSAVQNLEVLSARVAELEAQLDAARREADRARQCEDRYRQAVMADSDAFYLATWPAGRLLECNDEFEHLFGYLAGEAIGKSSVELGLYADSAERAQTFALLTRDGHLRDREVVGLRKTGERRDLLMSARVVELNGNAHLMGVLKDVTERNATLRTQQLLIRMLDEAPAGVLAHDEFGKVLYANQGASTLYGHPQPDLVGMSLSALVAPEGEPPLKERLEQVNTGALSSFETVHCRKDGSRLPLHVEVRNIDWLGQPAVMSVLSDLTERKQAERQVAERLEFEILLAELSAVFLSAPVGHLEADLGEAQRRVCACLGITHSSLWLGEAAPPHAIVLAHQHHAAEALAPMGKVVGAEVLPWVLCELHLGRSVLVSSLDDLPPQAARDRETLSAAGIETSFTMPLLAAGSTELLGALSFETNTARAWPEELLLRLQLIGGLFTSALHRRRALQELTHSAGRFGTLFHANPLPMAYSGVSDGRVIDCNDAFLQLVGRPHEQVIGRPTVEFNNLWPSQAERAALVARLLKGDRAASEVTIRDGSGEPRNFLMSGVVLELSGERALLMIGQDISAAKKATLDRTKLEEQLRQSQKMEAIGSLAGGVAHDFNNLLSVILSFTGFALADLREGDPLREDLLEVSKAGQRAVALTRQLLAFGRKQVLQPRVIDLNQICRDLEKMLRRLIGEDIEFRQVLLPYLGAVQADPGQVEQVIMNLAVNARDAMPRGGTLTFETSNVVLDEAWAAAHAGVEAGEYVQLAITDTGTGMDLATQQRVFEPFFTTKEKGKGTGLGLSMVYGIVTQSGGSVTLSSEPGQGTTFRVHLPRLADVRLTPLPGPPPTGPVVGTETVLLVEDEDAVRRAAARMLEAAGYQVLMAAHGGEALLTCERHPGEIHLLLTDVVMPQMGGQQLAQRLGKERLAMKVLYMSGYTDAAIEHHGVLEPGTRLLVKPFDRATLLRKVRDALDDRAE